jgi:hypothetical protein
MTQRKTLFILLFCVFAFRLFFGLCQSEWNDPDEKQTYLIGLKCYATGSWPTFGADAAGSESSYQSQIPGALEGLMIALPFFVLPIPEAPYLWLNLLSTLGVALLAWFLSKRFPRLSFPWLVVWISVLPWSLQEATHIYNVSYIFLPSVLFFIGFMESVPVFSQNLVRPAWAFFLMGLSVGWIMQFHFSYVYLLPLAAFSLVARWKKDGGLQPMGFFLLGLAALGILILPTYLQYGFSRADSHSGFFVPFDADNFKAFFTILARFLSLASFEMPRFLGAHTADRLDFLKDHPALLVPGLLLWIAGLVQPLFMLGFWFLKKHSLPAWPATKWLLLVIFILVYGSFWFTIKKPLSHIYFIFFPFLLDYVCYGWTWLNESAPLRTAAKVFLVLAFLFQLGYAFAVAPTNSLYTQRALVAKALQAKDYRILGERRPNSYY